MRVFLRFQVLLLVLILGMIPFSVKAHTVLETSKPAEGETVTTPVQNIELQFAESIEPLSVIEIKNSSGEVVKASENTVNDNILTGTFEPALTSGEYTVMWKIVGKDGHIIEGEYEFSVNAPANEPEPAPVPQEEVAELPAPEPSDATDSPESNNPSTTPTKQRQDQAQSASFVTYIVAALVIIVVAVLFFMRRRRG